MASSVSSMSHLSSEVPEASPSALAGESSSRHDLRGWPPQVPSSGWGTPILGVALLAAIVVYVRALGPGGLSENAVGVASHL